MRGEKPGFWRYLGIIFYDACLLLAVLFFATLLILPINHGAAFNSSQVAYPFYLIAVSFCFYGWFWTHGGQTLGLRSWKAKVLSINGDTITWRQAFIRFAAALISFSCFGLGFIWRFFDKNGRTWHDLISKTELVLAPENLLRQ
ncbi:hypothetical protein MCAMS1_00196 [biofilm metagenome]